MHHRLQPYQRHCKNRSVPEYKADIGSAENGKGAVPRNVAAFWLLVAARRAPCISMGCFTVATLYTVAQTFVRIRSAILELSARGHAHYCSFLR
jgi:hypothetical protein